MAPALKFELLLANIHLSLYPRACSNLSGKYRHPKNLEHNVGSPSRETTLKPDLLGLPTEA